MRTARSWLVAGVSGLVLAACGAAVQADTTVVLVTAHGSVNKAVERAEAEALVLKQRVAGIRGAFPDLHITIHDLIAEVSSLFALAAARRDRARACPSPRRPSDPA